MVLYIAKLTYTQSAYLGEEIEQLYCCEVSMEQNTQALDIQFINTQYKMCYSEKEIAPPNTTTPTSVCMLYFIKHLIVNTHQKRA